MSKSSRTPARYDRRHDHSRDRGSMADRFPKRPADHVAVHAPDRFDPGEVLKRTGFRVRNEGAAARDDLSSMGRAVSRLGAGDFTGAGANLALTVIAGLLGLILLDLLLSKRGATITGKAIAGIGGAFSRIVSPTDVLTSPGAGAYAVASASTATASSPAVPAGGGAGAGGYHDPVPGAAFRRVDQGVDLQGKPGQPVRAIGDATVDAVKPDPGGFGMAVYYTLLNGPKAGQQFYVGHAQPLVKPGDQLAGGAPVARLLANPLGNATLPGWTELGFAKNGAPAPNAGAAFKAFLEGLLGAPNTKTTTNSSGGTTTVTGP